MSDKSRTINISSLRESLGTQRDAIRELHDKGLPSTQVSARLASVVDAIVVSLFDASLVGHSDSEAIEHLRSQVAIVGLGSYARRQCSPFSDVDLMILHNARSPEEISTTFRPLTQGIFDIGLQLGHSVRTTSEATQLAKEDAVICTSMIDSRLLIGSKELYDDFRSSFQKMIERNRQPVIRSILDARTAERDEYGTTVYLLEPHVKRSRGGLRDLNLLRWLGFAERGVSDPDRLQLLGAISKFDHRRLINTRQFLLRLRNELHFNSGTSHDLLNRAKQLEIAEKFGYRGGKGMLPVERFMRDYFRHTNHLWQLVRRRDASLQVASRVSRVLDPMLSKTVEGDYRIGLQNISATKSGLAKIKQDMGEVLRLVELSRQQNKDIDHATWSALLLRAPEFPDVDDAEVQRQFWNLLGKHEYIGDVLRVLHELGYLEKLVPPMRHARCLLQFNQYHKFTVDEHCIRSVRKATSFADRKDVLGEAYREIPDKRTLHLALLLHDLGKGFEEDHSEVGKRIAEETTSLLKLDERAASDIAFLVHKHLVMSHLAFRRDTSDTQLIKRFAAEIGSVDRLRMLFVMTCADLAAVGPGVLNDWKIDVLADVYHRSVKHIQQEGDSWTETQLELRRSDIRDLLTPKQQQDEWFERQIQQLPDSYLARRKASSMAEALARLNKLSEGDVDVWCEPQQENKPLLFTAGVDRGSGRGVFSSMAGALSAASMQILSADTNVLDDGLLLLHYETTDQIDPIKTPPDRIERVCQSLVTAVDAKDPPKFQRQWGLQQSEESKRLTQLSNKVRVDNRASESCTVVEVFTFDRSGLLFELARRVHDLELIIQHAKIGTFLDQVVDVFYVTNRDLQKITDEQHLEHIRQQIFEVIND